MLESSSSTESGRIVELRRIGGGAFYVSVDVVWPAFYLRMPLASLSCINCNRVHSIVLKSKLGDLSNGELWTLTGVDGYRQLTLIVTPVTGTENDCKE
jgi:hypothetical protein